MTFSRLKIFHWPRGRAGQLQCRLVLLLLAVSLFTILSGISAAEKLPPPQVIILNSYHPGYTWSDNELTGVLQELLRVYPDIDPGIEYLDTKRFPSDAHLLGVKDYLAHKYRGRKFDLVIALDNPALMMVLGHRTELFPRTPIVFAGINDFQPAMLAGQEKVTGEAEILDIEGTLKSALGLHPETTKIFVVTDYTMTGRAASQDFEDILPRLPADVEVEFAPPATMAELVDRIKRLPATAIIFIAGFATDKAGQAFSIAEGVRRLTQEAKIPAYIVHEGRLGHGAVGGMLLEGEEHGRQAGKIALRVLAGADPSSIPVQTKSKARPMFDYHQLARFKIPAGALSPGSIIINRPSSFYEINKSLVWGAFGAVLVLGVMVLVLGANNTRRRRAEKELAYHLDFLQNLLETISNPVFYKDAKGVYLECNKALEDFLGLPKEGIVGKTVFDIYPKDLADKYYAMDQELFDHPGTQVYEFEMERPDGARRKFIFNKATFLNADGSLGGLIGVMTDITELKEAEAALRQANETLRATLDAAPVAIFDLDTEGRVKSLWNAAAEQMLGWRRDEALGKFLPSVPEEGEAEFAQFREWVRSGKLIMGTDVVRRRKDGSRIEYSIYAAPEYDDYGKVMGNIAVLMDITERKRTETALQQGEQKFRLLYENAPLGYQSLDEKGLILDVNQTWLDILGYSREEAVGRWFGDFLAPGYVDHFSQNFPRFKEAGQISDVQFDLVKKDGSLIKVSFNGKIACDEQGRFLQTHCMFQDITARKQAEEALQQERLILRDILEATLAGYWDWDIPNRQEYLSPTFKKMLGYEDHEIPNSPEAWKRLIFPEDLPGVLDTFKKHVESRGAAPYYNEVRYRHKDGSTIWVICAGRIIEWGADGEPLRMAGCHVDITERKRAEEELRLKEKLLDSASDSIFLHDLEGKLLYINEAAYITRWYMKEELLNQGIAVLLSPEVAADRGVILTELLANGELIFESEHLRKDGSIMPVEICARVLEVGGRELILSVARDITERRRAEEAIKLNEARLAGLLRISQYQAESIQDLLNYSLEEVIALTASKLGYIYLYDDSTQQFTLNTWSRGVRRECTIGEPQTIYQLEHTGIWGEAVRQARPVMVNDFQAPHPLKKGYPAGHATLHKYLTIPIFSDNRIVAVVGVANKSRDYDEADIIQFTLMMDAVWKIVERRRASEEVQAAAQKWRTTFDAITDAVFLMDPDGIILQCNQALADLVQKPFTDILGRRCCEVVHGTPQNIPYCPLLRMRVSKQREEMLLPMNGRWYKVGVDPLLDEAGNLLGAVHIISDVTQLTETERSLHRRTEELMLLNTIGSIVSRSLDLNEILEDSLRMIQQNLFQQQSGIIVFFLDEATGGLKAASHRGVAEDHPCLRDPVNLEECFCGRVALNGEMVFTREGCKDHRESSLCPDIEPHQDICLPLKVGDRVIGVVHISVNPDQEVDERHLKLLKAITDQISLAVEKARLFEQVKFQGGQLRTLSARLAEIEEAERKVLARELHDQVGQSLTTLSLYLTMLMEQMPQEMPDQILNRLAEATALVEDTSDSVREIMGELRPPVLDDFGLLAAARWLGKQFSKSTGISLQTAGEEPTPRLDRKVEMGLFRIIQEALNNVAKHAKASQVIVAEEVYDDRVRLTIADNGIGFDPKQVGQPRGRHRWGLMNMGERALAAGGTCRIESQPGGGTRVIVEVKREVLSTEN